MGTQDFENNNRSMTSFKLWLEFEEVTPEPIDKENDFANIVVELSDGRIYGINVWTFGFFETSLKEDRSENLNLNGLYSIPPDLFVKELTRNCIQKTIEDLLEKGDLDLVLNPSILIK